MAAVKTTRALYKYLMRETQKLPNDASKFYQTSVRNGYEQHLDETDPLRLEQIIQRSIEDADWIVKKYSTKAAEKKD